MRKFAWIICVLPWLASLSNAQQVDVAAGISDLVSSSPTSASLVYLPPSEKGGKYPSGSISYLFKNRFGVNAEIAVRSDQGLYNGYQYFRPVLYDFNAVFAPSINHKIGLDFLAGVGGERTIFYDSYSSITCNFPGGCPARVSDNHLLGHLGADARYYFWRSFFVRPEGHLYWVHKNSEFSSNYVGRFGVSVGYTFGRTETHKKR